MRPENAHAGVTRDQAKTTNASASGDGELLGLLENSIPSTDNRETPVPTKASNRRRKKGAAATGHPRAKGASASAFGGKEPELGTPAKNISAFGDKKPQVGKPGGGDRGGGKSVPGPEASCGGFSRGGSSPGAKGSDGCKGRNGEAESGAFGGGEADEVDVYAVLDFEATCEDRRIDGGR